MSRRELAVGIGIRRGTDEDTIRAAVRAVVGRQRVACLATIDRRADDSGLRAVAASWGVPIVSYPAHELARVPVPNPSARTAAALGTASVAEAAALLAGRGSLVIGKTTIHAVVIAAAVVRESPVTATDR